MSSFGYYRPGSLHDVLEFKEQKGDRARLLAGGSNLMVYLKESAVSEGTLVDIFALPDLKGIRRNNETIEIGASEVIADLLGSAELRVSLPLLADALAHFANPLVRARATIGGNIADASPIADTVPPLLCMQATLTATNLRGEREIPLVEFFTGPNATVLRPDEVIRAVHVPVSAPGHGSFQKLGLRNGTSCSVTSVAVWLETDGGRVKEIRIACGGVAPTPVRASQAEKAFRGCRVEQEAILEASWSVQNDIRPISDVRASAEYRREVTARLLARAVRGAAGVPED